MDENQKYALNMQWMRTDGKAKCCKCKKEFSTSEMYMGRDVYYCSKHDPLGWAAFDLSISPLSSPSAQPR